MLKHPSPFSYQKKKDVEENIIGWFALTFKQDVNHEYLFTVYKDGRIVREYDFLNEESDPTLFYKFLQDEDLDTVIFTRQDGLVTRHKWGSL